MPINILSFSVVGLLSNHVDQYLSYRAVHILSYRAVHILSYCEKSAQSLVFFYVTHQKLSEMVASRRPHHHYRYHKLGDGLSNAHKSLKGGYPSNKRKMSALSIALRNAWFETRT